MFACTSYRSCGTVYKLPVRLRSEEKHGKYYCCVTKCHNFSGRVGSFGRHVTLHKLPKEVYTRRAWIRLISRKNWKPSSYTRVCSDHFKDGVGLTSQDRNKIPSENLPQKQKKVLVRRDPPKRICRDPERTDSSINTTDKAGILKHHSWVLHCICSIQLLSNTVKK